MFESSDYPKPLDETLFETWLEEGRMKKIPYHYLLIIWNVFDEEYQSAYVEDRQEIQSYEWYPHHSGQEGLVAVFDLYSGSRVIRDEKP